MPRPRRGRAARVTLRLLILDTGSHHIDAMDELELCNEIAIEMQRYRETGFNLVEGISLNSTDPESREQARRAVVQFVYSEGLLSRIATHLNQGLEEVDAAHTATRQALTLVTRWRGGS